jgi:hypothetical protein
MNEYETKVTAVSSGPKPDETATTDEFFFQQKQKHGGSVSGSVSSRPIIPKRAPPPARALLGQPRLL